MNDRIHKGIFAFEELEEPDELVIPEDLSEVIDADLDALLARAVEAFDTLYDQNPDDVASVATLGDLAAAVTVVREEQARRAAARADAAAAAAALRDQVHAQDETEEEEAPAEEAPAEEDDGGAGADEEARETVTAAVTIPAEPRRHQRLNIPLSEIRARAPQPEAPPRLAITAAADVPGFHAGAQFEDMGDLAAAMQSRARSVPIQSSGNVAGPTVATIHNTYDHVLSLDSSDEEVDRVMRAVTNPDALVAGGGWCSPSETSYSFFDITCEDGMIDLPTFGVRRGGIRFPVSPSLADVFTGTFTSDSNPWLWTETDDQATVTGSPNKPCVRVPCPSFTDVRLECYGICLTAGNLTDNAFPEATERQIGLLRSAHYHAMNQRYIATMVSLASASVTGGMFNDAGAFSSDLPTQVEWAAADYRNRYGMCDNDILEVVLPAWAKAVFRADLTQRTALDLDAMLITDAQIDQFFDVRRIRVQWVKDYQVRGTNQPGGSSATSLFPASVNFLIYAAGTFGLGNGMTLDLGVVRDSTLNAENDHTALWTEECHLIAKFGHEARQYTVAICAAGRTGVANLADCRTS